MIRGGLIEAVFEKILKLSEDKDVKSEVLILIVSDVQQITMAMTRFQIETAIATWVLWRQVGVCSIVVLALALGLPNPQVFSRRFLSQRSVAWIIALTII